MINILKKFISNPSIVFLKLLRSKLFLIIPDENYLKIVYKFTTKKKLNLLNPKSFNEKIQWLKINDRNPNYIKFVDKYEAREYVRNKIGDKYLVPIIGVYSSVDEINFDLLPDKYVLKCTHDSGSVIICKDKRLLDVKKVKRSLTKALEKNYYYAYREWPYKKIKPRIICEEYVVDESGIELKDYKFMCFNGEPRIIQVISGRNNGHYYINHYDLNWNKVEIKRKNHCENPNPIAKPKNLNEMISISRILCKDLPFARIDLYNTGDKIYFSEITLYPMSGYIDFANPDDDLMLGEWLNINNIKKN